MNGDLPVAPGKRARRDECANELQCMLPTGRMDRAVPPAVKLAGLQKFNTTQ